MHFDTFSETKKAFSALEFRSSITKNNSKKSRLTKRFSSNHQVSTQTDSFSSPLLRHQLNTGKLNPFNMFHFFSESAFALPMGDGTIFGPITKNLSFIRRVFARSVENRAKKKIDLFQGEDRARGIGNYIMAFGLRNYSFLL